MKLNSDDLHLDLTIYLNGEEITAYKENIAMTILYSSDLLRVNNNA